MNLISSLQHHATLCQSPTLRRPFCYDNQMVPSYRNVLYRYTYPKVSYQTGLQDLFLTDVAETHQIQPTLEIVFGLHLYITRTGIYYFKIFCCGYKSALRWITTMIIATMTSLSSSSLSLISPTSTGSGYCGYCEPELHLEAEESTGSIYFEGSWPLPYISFTFSNGRLQ